MAQRRSKSSPTGQTRAFDPNRVSIHDLRARLSRLVRADLNLLSVSQLEQRIGLILHQVPLRVYPLAFSGVYRARPGGGHRNARDLWYPPPGVSRLGRLNEAGGVVLYAANTPHTALFELRPVAGQTYTALLARTKQSFVELQVTMLGITQARSSDIAEVRAALAKRDASLRQALGNGNYKKYALLDQWLTSAITAEVPPDNPDQYKVTAALANILFRAPLDAITYPSVATDQNGINLCLLPSRADELLRPAEAWEFEVVEDYQHPATGRHLYKVQALRKTTSIDQNGTLVWGPNGAGVGADDLRFFARGQLGYLSASQLRGAGVPMPSRQ